MIYSDQEYQRILFNIELDFKKKQLMYYRNHDYAYMRRNLRDYQRTIDELNRLVKKCR